MTITFPLPEWVYPIPLGQVDTAQQELTELLVEFHDQGEVRRAEFESMAHQTIEEAFDEGIWLLALARPPGQPAALLSVVGIEVPALRDEDSVVELTCSLDEPGVSALRILDLPGLGPAVSMIRDDASGSQAQVLLTEPDRGAGFLLTLAAPRADRGPELRELLNQLVSRAGSVTN